MADVTGNEQAAALPPKLDLRKSGILKAPPAPSPEVSAAPAPAAPAAAPVASAPGPATAAAQDSGSTMRIKLNEPVPTIRVAPPGGAPAAAARPGPTMSTVQVKRPAAPTILGAPPAPKPSISLPPPSASAPAPAAAVSTSTPAGTEPGTTMRIQVPESVPTARPAPTIQMKRPGAMGPAAGVPTMAKPASVVAAPVVDRKPSPKSETSRIPLEMAVAGVEATLGKPPADLKTIRIKPAGGVAGGIKIGGMAPAMAGAASSDKANEEKRKTSRISLEAALAMDENKAVSEGAGGAPKTIRLKRPGEAATVIKDGEAPTIKAEPSKAAMSQTAKLDDAAVAEEEGPSPTRKKTIKLKRSGDQPVARSISVAQSGGAEGGASPAGGRAGAEREDSDSSRFEWIFVVAAILAILVSFIVLYMFSAQAFGPHSCLTQLSYGAPSMDLGWPGKMPPTM